MKERFYASGRTLKARGPLALDAKPTVDQAHQLGISMDSALVGPAQVKAPCTAIIWRLSCRALSAF